jgi:pimeloyl-ACP methyl ester carboxylesterase
MDKSCWSVPVALLRDRIRSTVYDRRGTASWPLDIDDRAPLVEDHSDDAADVILGIGGGSAHVCATSFGAVIALDLMKRRPELVRSAILFEPALSGDDRTCSVPSDLLEEVERLIRVGPPERAAEYFCRRTLGDAVWAALPAVTRQNSASKWRQIQSDLRANAAYRMQYSELSDVDLPVLLLKGGRSRASFEPCLQALHVALRGSRRQLIARAEHILRGDAWREVGDALTAFIDNVSAASQPERAPGVRLASTPSH